MPKKNIILWRGGEPSLYCRHMEGEMWHVINGNWEFTLKGLVATDLESGNKHTYDRKTIAPKASINCRGRDEYNEVMEQARKNYKGE